jgi:glutamate synthase (NADPH/NADH)
MNRGINEGRMAARDVDSYLTGHGTQLPVSGGIVKRVPYDILEKMHGGIQEQPEVAAVAA